MRPGVTENERRKDRTRAQSAGAITVPHTSGHPDLLVALRAFRGGRGYPSMAPGRSRMARAASVVGSSRGIVRPSDDGSNGRPKLDPRGKGHL